MIKSIINYFKSFPTRIKAAWLNAKLTTVTGWKTNKAFMDEMCGVKKKDEK